MSKGFCYIYFYFILLPSFALSLLGQCYEVHGRGPSPDSGGLRGAAQKARPPRENTKMPTEPGSVLLC